jgi:hypothetical protein
MGEGADSTRSLIEMGLRPGHTIRAGRNGVSAHSHNGKGNRLRAGGLRPKVERRSVAFLLGLAMFSYSCPHCSQRLLAPTEKAGSKTICPKCLKPVTVPAHDRMAAVDLEAVIDGSHAEINLASGASGSLSSDTGNAPYDYQHAPAAYANTVQVEPQASFEIDLDAGQNTVQQLNSCTVTPPPAASIASPTPMPMPTAASYRKTVGSDLRGVVNLTPTGMFSVDMAAQLTATLSMRMAPPPENSSERKVTTAAWVLVTVAAIAVWLAGVFVKPDWFICVALLGGALVAFGYAWRAYLAGRDGRTLRGLVTLIPPVNAIAQLKPNEVHGHRPLRFVLSGLAVLGLFHLGKDSHAAAEAAFKQIQPAVPPVQPSGIAGAIRELSDQQKDDQLLRYVRELPYSMAFRNAGTEERAEATAQLLKLTQSPRQELREVAYGTLVECSPEEARSAILGALRSSNTRDLGTALASADRVASPEIATAVVEKVGNPQVGDQAVAAVRRIGFLAEPALIAQLWADRPETVVVVCGLLGDVGTAKAIQPLQRRMETTDSEPLRNAAKQAQRKIRERDPAAGAEKVSAFVEPAPMIRMAAFAKCTP